MKDQISKVLKMVEEGKIDSEKATELINALKNKEELSLEKKENILYSDERMLRVKVKSGKGDNVDVNLPIKFVKSILKACGSIPMMKDGEINGVAIDTQAIIYAIDNDINGKIIDVTSAKGDIVEVSID